MRYRRKYQHDVLEDMFNDWLAERLGKLEEKKPKVKSEGHRLSFAEGIVVAMIMQPIVGAAVKAIEIYLGAH